MTDPTSQPSKSGTAESSDASASQSDSTYVPPTPLRCFTGSVIAGGFAYVLYLLTQSIITSFANKPLSATNQLAAKIGVAVRTLVVGISTLGTGIFAIAAIGLLALGIQLLFKQLRQAGDR